MLYIFNVLNSEHPQGQKETLLFPEMRVTRKIFTRATGNSFFKINFPKILFSSLVYFAFFVFFIVFLFCLFVCSLKLKIYILIQIRLCRRVSDKFFFNRPVSMNKTTFFGPGFVW